jgi:hypothetical protein
VSEAAARKVFRLAPENISALWPQISAMLKPGLRLFSTHGIEDVRRCLLGLRAQCWAQIVGSHPEAIVVTEFVDYPAGLFVRVWLAGAAPDCRMDDDAFYDELNHWRMMHGAVGFEAFGRHGWLRRVPHARCEGLIMRVIP